MINIAALFHRLAESEQKFYLFCVDLFAKEYGWTIEYTQNLTLPEVASLIKAIKERRDTEDIFTQINVAKGFSGKISSNRAKKSLEKNPDQEYKNLEALAKRFKLKIKEVKE